MNRKLEGPQSQLGSMEECKSFHLSGIKPLFVGCLSRSLKLNSGHLKRKWTAAPFTLTSSSWLFGLWVVPPFAPSSYPSMLLASATLSPTAHLALSYNGSASFCIPLSIPCYQSYKVDIIEMLNKYRVIKNYCRGFNNLSYTIHWR